MRVQKSVFEIVCADTDLPTLADRITRIIDHAHDSIRIYRMHAGSFGSVQTIGLAAPMPHRDPLII